MRFLGLTKISFLNHLCVWKIVLYHNRRVLDETHVFDVVILLHGKLGNIRVSVYYLVALQR